MSAASPDRADVMAVACADAFRGDGAILASAMGDLPSLGARLAKATFSPDLLLTDGSARIVDVFGQPEGYMPFRRVFDRLWRGRRHVMMGASQLDRFGNQNISCIGPHARPKVQLLGVRGAPGNTVCHTTSYFVPQHSPRVFVPTVHMISGVGTDRGARELRVVVTDLAVLDFQARDRGLRIRSLHPGVRLEQVQAATGFVMDIAPDLGQTRTPTDQEAAWLDRLDPDRRLRGAAS